MFDLTTDPYELADHAHDPAFHAHRQRLHDLLAQWIERTGDTFHPPAVDTPAGTT